MNAAIARAISTLEGRITLLDRRIQALDAQPVPTTERVGSASDLNTVMDTLLRLHTESISLRVRMEVLRAFGNLLETTPARSGYARSGWTLTSGENPPLPRPIPAGQEDVYHADRVEAAVREALANLPEDPLAPLLVGTAVPYMALLEAGLSDQAPAGFVAAAVENLRARLELLAHEDRP